MGGDGGARRGSSERLVGQLRFDAGNLTLNLIATVGRRFGTPVERLTDPARLDAWVRGVGLRLSARKARADDLERVLVFREHVNDLVRCVVAGTSPPKPAMVTLNAAAAAASPSLVATHRGVELGSGAAVLADVLIPLIGRDTLLLVAGPVLERVRECAASDCRMFFLARAGDRRYWCSSAHCGNRHRVASHYARTQRRQAQPSPSRNR